MLILILIDVQYSQKAAFSFEKGSNCQKSPFPQQIFWFTPTPYRYLANPDGKLHFL